MYLHIGNNVIIKKSDIVGIFELDGKITTEETKKYLLSAQNAGRLVSAGDDLPKSFIIAKEDDGETVYLSHISISSLIKRCDLPF
ncbi:MAG: DUF370 domain-containing protein [Clostridia bacterium]|nr:DUF370 domain-containing protein [Clostridia bacterium]